jgi:hypothetical protein
VADNFALALQKGLLAALKANAGVTALVSSRIYDEPPQNVTFPYARFGDIAPDAFDTDTKEGAMVGISIEAHSRSASGRVEAVQIVEAVKEALHRNDLSDVYCDARCRRAWLHGDYRFGSHARGCCLNRALGKP